MKKSFLICFLSSFAIHIIFFQNIDQRAKNDLSVTAPAKKYLITTVPSYKKEKKKMASTTPRPLSQKIIKRQHHTLVDKKGPSPLSKHFSGGILTPKEEPSLKPYLSDLSGLKIEISAPESVKKDQLNDLELRFYTFNQRHVKSFLSAFRSSYHDFIQENPHIKLWEVSHQEMTAQVTFSDQGQIQSIQFIKTSDITPIQWLFQSILERNRLPNPPKELLIDNHLFITYSFTIN